MNRGLGWSRRLSQLALLTYSNDMTGSPFSEVRFGTSSLIAQKTTFFSKNRLFPDDRLDLALEIKRYSKKGDFITRQMQI